MCGELYVRYLTFDDVTRLVNALDSVRKYHSYRDRGAPVPNKDQFNTSPAHRFDRRGSQRSHPPQE